MKRGIKKKKGGGKNSPTEKERKKERKKKERKKRTTDTIKSDTIFDRAYAIGGLIISRNGSGSFVEFKNLSRVYLEPLDVLLAYLDM